ncbi:MAG: transporter substrate-binding domain-containing protein [Motiliproteus sp.]
MIHRRTVIFAIPSLFFLTGHAHSREQQTIRLAYHPDIPPYSFQTSDQSATKGILPDLTDTLAFSMNLAFSHQSYPWERAQRMVELGMVDAFCCPITPERQRYAIFAPTPIIVLHGQVVFFNPASPNAPEIKAARRIEDFYLFKTATFLGNSRHDQIWKDHPNVEKVSRVEQILVMLLRGRIDFYFADPLVTGYKIKTAGLNGLLDSAPLGYIVDQNRETEMQFGLRRSYPEAEKLIVDIDTTIKKIITPELRKNIVSRYL